MTDASTIQRVCRISREQSETTGISGQEGGSFMAWFPESFSETKQPRRNNESDDDDHTPISVLRRTPEPAILKQHAHTSSNDSSPTFAPGFASNRDQTTEINEDVSSDDNELKDLYMSLKHLDLNPAVHRYFGKTANSRLIQSAISLKDVPNGASRPSLACILTDMQSKRPDLWHTQPVCESPQE
jgi:hypothetical protein